MPTAGRPAPSPPGSWHPRWPRRRARRPRRTSTASRSRSRPSGRAPGRRRRRRSPSSGRAAAISPSIRITKTTMRPTSAYESRMAGPAAAIPAPEPTKRPGADHSADGDHREVTVLETGLEPVRGARLVRPARLAGLVARPCQSRLRHGSNPYVLDHSVPWLCRCTVVGGESQALKPQNPGIGTPSSGSLSGSLPVWVCAHTLRTRAPHGVGPEGPDPDDGYPVIRMPHSTHARVPRLRPCRFRTQEPPRRVAHGPGPRARRLWPPHLRRPGRLPAVLPARRREDGRGRRAASAS